jgi:hypothetical protein
MARQGWSRMHEGTKHSSASRWHSSGMPLELVRRMLRHRDTRSTERYAKLADPALVEAFGLTTLGATSVRPASVLKAREGGRKTQRGQAPMAGRTRLESTTPGRKCPETQGSGSLKPVSRVYPKP